LPDDRDLERHDVEVVRKTVTRKDELEGLKAALEGRGFRVYVEEHGGEGPEGSDYLATITADRWVPLVERTVRSRREAVRIEKIADKKADKLVSILWWVLVLAGLAAILYLSAPTWRAILAFIKSSPAK